MDSLLRNQPQASGCQRLKGAGDSTSVAFWDDVGSPYPGVEKLLSQGETELQASVHSVHEEGKLAFHQRIESSLKYFYVFIFLVEVKSCYIDSSRQSFSLTLYQIY